MEIFKSLNETSSTVLQLLIAGVAFKNSHISFNIISHDGDFIGLLSNHHVETMVCSLRKLGVKRSNYPTHVDSELGVVAGITYGFEDWVDDATQKNWMYNFFKNPVILL